MNADRLELAECLSRLTARAVPWQAGVHGRPEFEGVELAGVLAGISQEAQCLAMVRYMDDRQALQALVDLLASEGSWGLEAGGRLRDLLRLAVWECTQHPLCRRCQGRRVVRVLARLAECPACGGAGHARIGDARRAALLGISRQAFGQVWSARYQRLLWDVRARVARWDDEIAAKLRRELRAYSD